MSLSSLSGYQEICHVGKIRCFRISDNGRIQIYSRCPRNLPFSSNPATPKLALALEDVPVIKPPPVLKSSFAQSPSLKGGEIPAFASEKAIIGDPGDDDMQGAHADMPRRLHRCLRLLVDNDFPSGKATVWLGLPEIGIDFRFTTSPIIFGSEFTIAPVAVHHAWAIASRRFEAMTFWPMVT